jgi:hypothetical protein
MLLGWAYLINCFPVPAGQPAGTGEVRIQWISDELDGSAASPTDPPASATESEETIDVPSSPVSPDLLALHSEFAAPSVVSRLEPETAFPVESPEIQVSTKPNEQSDSQVAFTPLPSDALVSTSTQDDPSTLSGRAAAQFSESPALSADAPMPPRPEADETKVRTDESLSPNRDDEFVLSYTDTTQEAVDVPDAALRARADGSSQAGPANGPGSQLQRPAVVVPPSSLPVRYQGRVSDRRRALAEQYGGSPETEAAVDAALEWLAGAQNKQNGSWENRVWEGGRETRDLGGVTEGVKADTAVTGLALLSYLGAGHTHSQGPYQETIRRGLEFLVRCQSPQSGSLAADANRYVAMYCHGIATLAMSEAMIMTNDQQLRRPLQRAIDYTVRCQHPITGGWRYQPGDLGDTSQYGWQLMALVSAESAGIPIPDRTWQGAQRWMRRVSIGQYGGLACYIPERPVASASMTAEALFCRTFLPSAPQRTTVDEAATFVAQYGGRPEALNDLYFCYYATLALYQLQDQRWQNWNQSMTQYLVRSQRSDGALAGSWDVDARWGPTGGRVYSTSMACLCLETYYRYLPVYELAVTRGRSIQLR